MPALSEGTSLATAAEAIAAEGIQPVVLFPGDTWNIGEDHDSATAVKGYEEAWDPASRTRLASPTVALADLEGLGTACAKRLRKRNNRLLLRATARLGIGAPLTIRVTDLGLTVVFDPLHGLSTPSQPRDADIALTSQSLAYTLRFDWGADTLSVNGRFEATAAGYRKMLRTFGPSILNNNGRGLQFRLLADPWLVRRAVDRFLLRAS